MNKEEIKDIFNLICNYRALNYFGYNSSEIGYTALNEALSLIDKLQKENNIKDKVIDNLYADIEYEYSGTNYLKSLDEYYEEAQDE